MTIKEQMEHTKIKNAKLVEAMRMDKRSLADSVYRNVGWIANIRRNPYMARRKIPRKCAPPLPVMSRSFYMKIRKWKLAEMYADTYAHAEACRLSKSPPDVRWVGSLAYDIVTKGRRKILPDAFIKKVVQREWR